MRARGLLAIAVGCGLGIAWLAAPVFAVPSHASLQDDALKAFQQGRFDEVVRLLEETSAEQHLSPEVLRAGVRSALRVGRPDQALTFYTRLVPPGRPDDAALLRDLALAIITRHVRDPQEHLRIAAYLALTDVAPRDAVPLFEDGLLDSSVMVRARAAEGLARARSSATTSALARALDDPAPSVRIAALNALGAKTDPGLRPRIVRLSKSEEGVLHIFALAALARMGQSDAVDEIAGEATLPDAELRMAAVGALGQLKRPSSLPILSQSVYDPDPSVRAFAAGALGDFGNPKGEPALLHALEDDDPRVRSIAAASLGRLKLAQSRPVLRQAARDPVGMVRVGAVEGLLRLGDPEAVLFAADLAKHPDPSVRGATAQAVASSGNRKAFLVVESLLKDQQPQPRLMATRAIGKLGGREALALLKHALNDSDPAIRIAAAGGVIKLLTTK
jgi:HEAT repeat protein